MALQRRQVVLTTFAGRQDRMNLLVQYAKAAIQHNIISEWHIWDFSRKEADANWLKMLDTSLALNDETYDLRQFNVIQQKIYIQIEAKNDAHICIHDYRNPDKVWEIVLGGNGNTRSMLRTEKNGADVTYFDGVIFDTSIIHTFIIEISGNYCKVFHNSNQILHATREDIENFIIGIKEVKCGWGSFARFYDLNLPENIPPIIHQYVTIYVPSDEQYHSLPDYVQFSQNAFQILCKTNHNAHLLIHDQTYNYYFEVCIDGWEGTRSIIRSQLKNANSEICTYHNEKCLNNDVFNSIECIIEESNTLIVLVNNKEVLRAKHPDTQTFKIKQVQVMNGWESDGYWKVKREWKEPIAPSNRIRLYHVNNKKIWKEFYEYYRKSQYGDTIFLKADDDIVYLDVKNLGNFIKFRKDNLKYFIVSANTVNNGVCAFFQQNNNLIPKHVSECPYPPGGNQGLIWRRGDLAEKIHLFFGGKFKNWAVSKNIPFVDRISINFISWTGKDIPIVRTCWKDDEHNLSVVLPDKYKRPKVVYMLFTVAHLSFYAQESQMNIARILLMYDSIMEQTLSQFS